MRKAKDNRDVPKCYYRPEITTCPSCGTRLQRRYTLWDKYLVTLQGRRHLFSQGYVCPNPTCPQPGTIYRSAEAERVALKGSSFGLDLLVQVGYWHFWEHQPLDELHRRLAQDRHLPISRRQIAYLLGDFLALLRSAQPQRLQAGLPVWRRRALTLAIDGLQPEKGNDCLYLVREVNLDVTLVAENLLGSSVPLLKEQLLQPLKKQLEEGGVRVRGIVTDAQETLRQAVAEVFVGVPWQSCQFHCLRDAGKLTFAADQKMKTDLKKALRYKLAAQRRQVHALPSDDPCRAVLRDYGEALRATLQEGGVAPFALGGVRVFEDWQRLERSLRRCQKKGGIRCWTSSCVSSKSGSRGGLAIAPCSGSKDG